MNGEKLYQSLDYIEDQYLEESYDCSEMPIKTRWKYKTWTKVVAAIAVACVLLIGTVNLLPKTAYAISNILGLRELVAVITFDPSMKACLQNEYAQYVGESGSDHGYTAKVYYMVVDASQISIFFQCDTPRSFENNHPAIFNIADVTDSQGNVLGGSGQLIERKSNNLYEFRLDLNGITDNSEIPKSIHFRIDILGRGDDNELVLSTKELAQIQFTLNPDLKYTASVKTYLIHKTIKMKEQTIELDRLEVYPTKSKLYFKSAENNTALLNNLSIELYDEKGNSYTKRYNDIIGTITENGEVLSKWYESPYFTSAKSIKAIITAVAFMDKKVQTGLISYEDRKIENMPANVSIASMELDSEGSLEVWMKTQAIEDEVFFEAFYNRYMDVNGKKYDMKESGMRVKPDEHAVQYEVFKIPNYVDHKFKIIWSYSPLEKLDHPIEVQVFSEK